VAAAAGVPVSTVRKIAQGWTKNPRIGTVEKINKALDLSERIAAKYGQIAA
jgi:predicted transcriptional regulator